jgi:hypothetical protein
MAIESLTQRLAATNLDKLTERELRVVLGAMLDALQAVAAKLDADAGVTDTNYAATVATYVAD